MEWGQLGGSQTVEGLKRENIVRTVLCLPRPYFRIGTAFEPETCVTNISSIEKHCATAPHYYVDTDYHGRPLHEKRYVQDADCLLWSWLPIVLVMFVMMHIFWALLMKSQGK